MGGGRGGAYATLAHFALAWCVTREAAPCCSVSFIRCTAARGCLFAYSGGRGGGVGTSSCGQGGGALWDSQIGSWCVRVVSIYFGYSSALPIEWWSSHAPAALMSSMQTRRGRGDSLTSTLPSGLGLEMVVSGYRAQLLPALGADALGRPVRAEPTGRVMIDCLLFAWDVWGEASPFKLCIITLR